MCSISRARIASGCGRASTCRMVLRGTSWGRTYGNTTSWTRWCCSLILPRTTGASGTLHFQRSSPLGVRGSRRLLHRLLGPPPSRQRLQGVRSRSRHQLQLPHRSGGMLRQQRQHLSTHLVSKGWCNQRRQRRACGSPRRTPRRRKPMPGLMVGKRRREVRPRGKRRVLCPRAGVHRLLWAILRFRCQAPRTRTRLRSCRRKRN